MPYDVPDDLVAAIIDAPPTPVGSLSPDGLWLLLIHYEAHPPIALLARPFRSLGGLRIDPDLGLRRRTTRVTGLSLVEVATGAERPLDLPHDASVSVPAWAPDSSHLAFTLDLAEGLELCIADVAEAEVITVPHLVLTDVLTGGQLGGGGPFVWDRDSQGLIAFTVPAGRVAPTLTEVPSPIIQQTAGKHTKMATFADMLKSEADEDAFETWGTTQLVRITLSSQVTENLVAPGLVTEVTESPDGSYLLVELLQRPFSTRVPYPYFARRTEVWSHDGTMLRAISDLPVSDEVPSHGVPVGPRSASWNEASPARLWWAEALDGGDPLAKVEHRDRLLELQAPFTGEPREWARLRHRYVGRSSLEDPGTAVVREQDRDRRWVTTWHLDADDPSYKKVLADRGEDDAYGDPGNPVSRRKADGSRTIVQEQRRILLDGNGASPEGNQPFLAWFDLDTLESTKVFVSPLESVDHYSGIVDGGILIRHESPTETPNYYAVDLPSGDRRQLTSFPDPHPQLHAATKRLMTYDRGDGVMLSGLLHLPPDHDPAADGPLPLVIWAYPYDYGNAATAGQVRSSPGAFTRLASTAPIWFTLKGFALLMDATMPVIGDPETMNDTFIEQMTAAAKAHIDALASEGIVDPSRVIAAGHSYGGFMTANLLAHTDLFAAGIARSGAYNRSLTPFGFQNERRPFWEAKDVYDRLSPFRFADQITDPILLIHGAADNNSGTYTIQSERLFAAIQATGGTARLVLLPHESHGYQARESVLHVLAEQFAWAQKYAGRPT